MKHPIAALLPVAGLLLSPLAWADLGFPDYVKFPPQVVVVADQALDEKALDSFDFSLDEAGATRTLQGHRYARWLGWKPAAGEPANGYYNGTEERIFKAMQASLASTGWKLVHASESHASATFRRTQDGRDILGALSMDAPQGQVRFEMVAPAAARAAFALTPPAATPERFTDAQDLPFLVPPPGSKRLGGGHADAPLDITPPGASGEPQLFGSRTGTRTYQGPSTLSQSQFLADYRQALTAAGWTVVFPASAKDDAGNATMLAHYARNGRDLWARLNYQYGASLSLQVAETARDALEDSLRRGCHVPLYGVHFDFNKATLRPDSEATLAQALAVLKAHADWNIEVQGHTDGVGGEDYNLKLSDARASSVQAWFAGHGIAAAHLSHKGYGKSQPVADNGTDAGRALNRRVELRNLGCR